jgi:hypothetical protein
MGTSLHRFVSRKEIIMTEIMTGTTLDLAAIARETQARLASIAAAQAALDAAKAQEIVKPDLTAEQWLETSYEVTSLVPGQTVTISYVEVALQYQAHHAKGMKKNPRSVAIFEEMGAIMDIVGPLEFADGRSLKKTWSSIVTFVGGVMEEAAK